MSQLVNEAARIVANEPVGPRLHLMKLESPAIAAGIQPGQFVHMKMPGMDSHVLRRPFSVYARDAEAKTIEVLYQVVGSVTSAMPALKEGVVETIGPIGNTWSAPALHDGGSCSHVLLVGGGVGAAPLFMLAESLRDKGCAFDVVLGAQTKDALVTLGRYEEVAQTGVSCATDDGSFGTPGFCTTLVEERLHEGALSSGSPYDMVCVCGPEPLMKIVAGMAADAGVACQVSMEKRMACGIGACLSCVVDTVDGKKRSCVDGPIFDARKVVW